MSEDSPRPAPRPDEDDRAVALYLREHPRFLEEHPDVLAALEVPHRVPGAVSLVSRQVAALRGEQRKLEDRLAALTRAAEDNQRILGRLHRLSCRLLGPAALARADLEAAVSEELQIDRARLVLPAPSPRLADDRGESHEVLALAPVLPERPVTVCRPLPAESSALLFGDPREHSCAFVPLEKTRGWIVLGARDPDRFHPGLGTLYLVWLGEILDARLAAP